MQRYTVYPWKQIPFIRLLIPFIAGIILQWYVTPPFLFPCLLLLVSSIFLFSYSFISDKVKYRLRWLQGCSIQVCFLATGMIVTYSSDLTHDKQWAGNVADNAEAVFARLKEPLVEKEKSYKATAAIVSIKSNGEWKNVKGDILIYFKKEDSLKVAGYGSEIIFTKPLQPIRNSGNPGAFDYQRYCAFQGIFHQVFLKGNDYTFIREVPVNPLWKWLYAMRESVINTLKENIQPEREAGVAEALLIGYRDDLDKELVQAYSNTGVVHIIAISGLHLGLIYGILLSLFSPFKNRQWARWLKPVTVLLVLWIFTLVAGGAPSILRSAVMFTCIVLGEMIDKKTSIYNTLAASAFIILCYDPFYLWDVGFQLSYSAVISIVTFMKPVYNWFFIKNKLLDNVWKLTSVTLSAQILTLPFILYHFHQFPNLFLITNFVSVPLSGFILYGELLLLVFSKVSFLAVFFGKACSMMLKWMNDFIENMNAYPFAITDNIQVSLLQSIFLAIIAVAFSNWLMRRHKPSFVIGLAFLLAFVIAGSVDEIEREHQHKMIVYNIPQHSAIDFISSQQYQFIGDTVVENDHFLQNFHVKPSRTLFGCRQQQITEGLYGSYPFIQFYNKKMLLIDKPYKFKGPENINVDAIIISKNPTVYIPEIAKTFACPLFIFDATNPQWKINLWKKDCDSLHLRHHSTADQGAFVMEL